MSAEEKVEVKVEEDLYELEEPTNDDPPKEAESSNDSEEGEEGEELPAYEAEARAEGWKPLDEWDGDPDDWVDAKEFNFRGKLMKRIQQQSSDLNSVKKENEEVKNALRALGEHNKKIAEQEYKRALKDLKQRKLDALEDDDHRTVLEIDEQIEDLQTSQKELENEEVIPDESKEEKDELPPEIKTWLAKDTNKWYHEDPIMRGAADSVFLSYMQQHPNDIVGGLEYVEKTMQKRFPAEMGVKTTPKAAAVTESDGRGNAGKRQNRGKKYTHRDLSEEQKSVAQTFVRQGVFKDIQEYVDQLVKTGELS